MNTATLLVRCTDRTGIVSELSSFVFRQGGNIVSADQYSDKDSGRFFMRLVWTLDDFSVAREEIGAALRRATADFEHVRLDLSFSRPRPRAAIFCGQTLHCLYDLLLRRQLGEFGGETVLVVSNHEDGRTAAEHFGVPFHFVPTDGRSREEAEAEQLVLLREYRVDLVVLARYMRILSPEFVAAWEGRLLNIHHSFLPAFAGAQPYRQAKRRGVKVIGATAHYVTAELDGGPIIEQDVTRITHRDTVEDMIRKGRDLERRVLARAVRLHLERRVLTDAGRTIVFR